MGFDPDNTLQVITIIADCEVINCPVQIFWSDLFYLKYGTSKDEFPSRENIVPITPGASCVQQLVVRWGFHAPNRKTSKRN